MCQKAFGGIGGLLVTANDLEWTRGTPGRFQSSQVIRRGFCTDCGTPLTFEYGENYAAVDIAIAAFDDAASITPVIQLASADRLPWFDELHRLPVPSAEEQARSDARTTTIISNQHPDHDTSDWEKRL
jgi:hypothetical protein